MLIVEIVPLSVAIIDIGLQFLGPLSISPFHKYTKDC